MEDGVHVVSNVICSDRVHAAFDRAEGSTGEEAGGAPQRSSRVEDYEVVSYSSASCDVYFALFVKLYWFVDVSAG